MGCEEIAHSLLPSTTDETKKKKESCKVASSYKNISRHAFQGTMHTQQKYESVKKANQSYYRRGVFFLFLIENIVKIGSQDCTKQLVPQEQRQSGKQVKLDKTDFFRIKMLEG